MTITAENPEMASCSLGAFVQDDLMPRAVAVGSHVPDDNFNLFYWVDVPPSDSSERISFLRAIRLLGVKGHFKAGYLSVSKGQRRYFTRLAIGHYFKGAFFRWGDKVNFLAQWTENKGIIGNIVSITP